MRLKEKIALSFFLGGDKKVSQHVEGRLMKYHHTPHSEAMQHLEALCKSLQQVHYMDFNPDTPESRKASPQFKNATHSLRVVDVSIHRQNKEQGLDTDLGRI